MNNILQNMYVGQNIMLCSIVMFLLSQANIIIRKPTRRTSLSEENELVTVQAMTSKLSLSIMDSQSKGLKFLYRLAMACSKPIVDQRLSAKELLEKLEGYNDSV